MADSGTRILVTGASGFIGSHLLDRLKDTHRIFAVAHDAADAAGRTEHPNVTWLHADLASCQATAALLARVQEAGGVDHVIHLAAYYDFTGKDSPEYERTNVGGTRHVLEMSRRLRPRRVFFASSVAACDFTGPGAAITESTPAADGNHYARSKRIGEEMLKEYGDAFPTCIIRFAALFSDWCEYLPLYYFMSRWLRPGWRSRILAGRGDSAIPYLHVDEAIGVLGRILAREADLADGEVLLVSPDGSTSHRELHAAATACHFGTRRRALAVPKPVCRVGLGCLDVCGRLAPHRPFERPWMGRCIDKRLDVDASRTRARLDWEPAPHLAIIRRMPFLVLNRRTYPDQWRARNHVTARHRRLRINQRIQSLIAANEDEICRRLDRHLTSPANRERFAGYLRAPREQLEQRHHLLLKQLMCSTRAGDMGVFMNCCRHLAERWHEQGLSLRELGEALEALGRVCVETLSDAPEARGLGTAIHDHVKMTIQFAVDAVHEVRDQHAVPQA